MSDCVTQMYFARRGEITDAMRRVAEREGAGAPSWSASEVARGRLIIPANVHHLAGRLDPMGDRHRGRREDQRQHRQLGRDVGRGRRAGEAALRRALRRRHGDGPLDRRRHRRDPRGDHRRQPGPDRHGADLPGRSSSVEDVADITPQMLLDNIEHQARQGVDYITVHCGILREHVEPGAGPGDRHREPRRLAARARGWCSAGSRTRSTRTSTSCSRSPRAHDVSLSLGDGLRPGSLADASDQRAVRRAARCWAS